MRRPSRELQLGETPMTWQTVSTGDDGGRGWSHSGIAVLPDGTVMFAHPEGGRLVLLDSSGGPRAVDTPLLEMHGLTVAVARDGTPLVWAADNGHRFTYGVPTYGEVHRSGRVVALSVTGEVRRELTCPSRMPWSPTSVAVVDDRDPESDVWVADGYGQNLVHRFDRRGALVTTLDGADTGLAFSCPHGIAIRGKTDDESELYVADRSNRRLVVYSLNGELRRVLGEDVLDSPSAIAAYHGHLLVTELSGSVAVFTGDEFVGRLGESTRNTDELGWPNRVDEAGNQVAPILLDGNFNSPHGICVFGSTIYVTEWLIGGRVIRLDPAP